MATFAWPDQIPVSNSSPQLLSTSKEGMPSLDGNNPVNVGPSQVWATSINLVVTRRDGVLLKYRELEVLFDGRINVCVYPFNEGTGPGYVAGYHDECTFDDGAYFDDGSWWNETYADIYLTDIATVGSTRVLLKVPDDVKVEVGQRFSFPNNRMHVVREILSVRNGVYTCNVRPTLRSSYDPGTVVDFENPKCLMIKASDNTGRLDLSFFNFGTPTIDLVEPKGSE